MNFKEFKESLKFRKYNYWKIIIRFIEYKIKNFLIDLLIHFNKFKKTSKEIVDLGSYSDNSYINFLLYSLKDEYIFAYKNDKNTKKLFRRIGFYNFFKHTIPNSNIKDKITTKINTNSIFQRENEIIIDTNYFDYFYKNLSVNQNSIVMPYFMYPRIYNSFYKKINILKKPDLNIRIFFSGSVVNEGYKNFKWKKEPEKFPNRLQIIEKILSEFKNDIFLIRSKKDLKHVNSCNKKIIFCLHDKMMKKTSYILNFNDNFNLLSKSCFNLNCPGVVMPLCHHLIEGMKVGSIPITNCEKFLNPNLSSDNSLQYSDLNQIVDKINEALIMDEDKIMKMRTNVLNYYKENLSPYIFKKNFKKIKENKKNKIICCDDHRSIDGYV